MEKKRLIELDVERINIVEEDGSLKMVISNSERMPDPIIAGKTFKRQAPPSPGIVFYNNDGDECGGLVFGNDGAALLFDAYKNDQVVSLVYEQAPDGKRVQGMKIWDRPAQLTTEVFDELDEINQLPDGPEKDRRMGELIQTGVFGASRMFVGKNDQGESTVIMRDSKGRDRIRLRVDTNDLPRIEFLDEEGTVVYSLPPKG